MSKAIKFSSDKYKDNIETVPELSEVIKTWLESLDLPFESYMTKIEDLEWQSRDGFIAASHNRGGFDLIAISDVSGLMGSGEAQNLAIADEIEAQYEQNRQHVRDSHPDLDVDSDEFYEKLHEYGTSDYDAIAWRVRVMYEGDGILSIYAGYDDDAPYFRWSRSVSFEKTIRFKTMSGLKRQLKTLTKSLYKKF